MATIKRHRPNATRGGRPVQRKFWFAPADGDKYPSESTSIRTNVVDVADIQFDSWVWALGRMKDSDVPLWLVLPIDQTDENRDKNVARSSIWRTATRNGYSITTEYVAPYLYVTLTD